MFKFVKFILAGYLIAAVIGSLTWLVLWKTQNIKLYDVQTGSMAPVLQPGDLAVSVKTTPKDVQIGDIVGYRSGQNSHAVITHRVYKTFENKGYLVTKGDNLAQPDPPIAYSAITGKTIKVVPRLGWVFSWLHQPAGLIGLVYLPALIISALELQKLLNDYSRHQYRAIFQ